MSQLQRISRSKCFEGFQDVYSFFSNELKCTTRFSVYLPPTIDDNNRAPVLYWLSGLTCTEENFIIKSGFQRYASELRLIVVGPDTSPRGCNIDGEDKDYDFGTGAGFYVDATTDKFREHYRMYSYVTKELIKVVEENFPIIPNMRSIFGHSMGGHGALICGIKNPGLYKSVSAFAPISNPSVSPWGIKCFTGYLGDNKDDWKQYDATELIANYNGPDLHLKIDQGSEDQYMDHLFPDNFVNACRKYSVPLDYKLQDGYDHSFYFVGTFLESHMKMHSNILKAASSSN